MSVVGLHYRIHPKGKEWGNVMKEERAHRNVGKRQAHQEGTWSVEFRPYMGPECTTSAQKAGQGG